MASYTGSLREWGDAQFALQTATHARYTTAPGPVSVERAILINRRWAASSSGSRSRRRRAAAATAPSVSPSTSPRPQRDRAAGQPLRSNATARVARQSSKSGLSRNENPRRMDHEPSAVACRIAASSVPPTSAIAVASTQTQGAPGPIGRPATTAPSPFRSNGQRPTEGAPGRRVIRLWPQKCREFVARERSILDGQQGENRQRLARVDDDWLTVDPHLERTHDSDHEPGIGRHRRSGLDMASSVTVLRQGYGSVTIVDLRRS